MQVPAISFANDSSNQPRKKKKKKPNQAEDFTTVAPPAVSRTVTGSTAKPQKRTHEELASPKSKKPKTSISGEEMTNRHKEMQLSETVKTGRKNNSQSQTKKKKKHKKKKPKSVGPVMSDERLKAFGINPKKYKYEYLKSLHEKNASKNGS